MLNPGNMLSLKDKGANATALSQSQECPDSRNIMPSVMIGWSNYPNNSEDDVIENHYVETPLS